MISGWGRIEVNLFAKIHLTLETKFGWSLRDNIETIFTDKKIHLYVTIGTNQ